MSVKRDSARALAVRVLCAVESGAEAKSALDRELASARLSAKDAALATEVVYGTLRHQGALDESLKPLVNRPLDRLDQAVRAVLRMSLYQLRHLDRIPAHAAVYEGVELARQLGHEGAARLTNAVLRRAQRQKGRELASIAVSASFPAWLVTRWQVHFGQEETEALQAWFNRRPETVIRVNTLRTSAAQLAERLANDGLVVEPGRYAPEALRLTGRHPAYRNWPSFQEGLFQVQDESSMLAALALAPRAGALVLDVCAAPGGKATHLAALMTNRGRVVANDLGVDKLQRIRENVQRLGTSIVETHQGDARDLPATFAGKADYVLADVPCTGTGVLGRRADARWRKREEDLERLPRLQAEILDAAARCLAPGGTLLYTTCSLEPEENQEVVTRWLATAPAYALDDLRPYLPAALRAEPGAAAGMLALLPHLHGVDGFFMARIRRR